jgi:hypothetical protein
MVRFGKCWSWREGKFPRARVSGAYEHHTLLSYCHHEVLYPDLSTLRLSLSRMGAMTLWVLLLAFRFRRSS